MSINFEEMVEEIISLAEHEVQRNKNMGYERSFSCVVWEIVSYYFETNKIDAYDTLADVYEFVGEDYTGNVYHDCKCGWHNYIVGSRED